MKYSLLPILFLFLFSCREKEIENGTSRQNANEESRFVVNNVGDTFYHGITYHFPGEFISADSIPTPAIETAPIPANLPFSKYITDEYTVDSQYFSLDKPLIIPDQNGIALPEKVAAKDTAIKLSDFTPEKISKMSYSKDGPVPIYSFNRRSPGLLLTTSILIDRLGMLYASGFGGGGIIKYDGSFIWRYSIESELASNLFISSESGLWFAINRSENRIGNIRNDSLIIYSQIPGMDYNKGDKIIEDEDRNLWFGTFNGLFKFDGQNFWKYSTKNGLLHNSISHITTDFEGKLWIATRKGLSIFDGRGFKTVKAKDGLNSNSVLNIFHDSKGNHWIGNEGHIQRIHNNKIFTYTINAFPSGLWIEDIKEDKHGNIYFATVTQGIIKFDGHYFQQFSQGNGYDDNTARDLEFDNEGNLWIAADKSIFRIEFESIQKIPNENLYKDGSTNGVHSNSHNLYVSTNRGYLDKINHRKKTITRIFSPEKVGFNHRFNPKVDSKGNLWFCEKGDILKSVHNGKILNYKQDPVYPGSSIKVTYLDGKDNLWLTFGRKSSSKTLGGFLKKNNTGIHFYTPEVGLPKGNCRAFCPSNKGGYWIGSDNVIYKFNNDSLTTYLLPNSDKNNNIESITEINDSTIFFCSMHDGLFRMVNGVIEKIQLPKDQTIKNDYPRALITDNLGNLWIQCVDEIHLLENRYLTAKISPEDFINLNSDDGIGEIGWPSILEKDKEGNLYFVGGSQLVRIKPSELLSDKNDLNIQIHSMMVNDSSYNSERNIELSHNQNSTSFLYSIIDIDDGHKAEYYYRLNGFDDKWTRTNDNRADFRKLPPGNYTFEVKSKGFPFKKSQIVSIPFLINPPWWNSSLAQTFYIILLLTGIFGFIRWRTTQIKLKAQKELETSKRIAESEIKSKVLTNISHEFRTPLTIIQGISERLLNSESRTDKDLSKIKEQSLVLLNLVDKLLTLSKTKNKSEILDYQRRNLVHQCELLYAQFESLFKSENIEFEFVSSLESEKQVYNPEVLETILKNLISNAIKFTDAGGSVKIELSHADKYIQLSVLDSGIGIPEKDLDKIFTRFFQSHNNQSKNGTGIGLALVKELAELHGGKVEVESKVGEGSKFSVYIPGDHKESKSIYVSDIHVKEADQTQAEKPLASDEEIAHHSNKILVVEDNPDLTELIVSVLDKSFNVETASNGLEGLNKAKEIIPDLILTDIMMPEMDGLLMTKKLKENKDLDHIPVIMLTAKASGADKLEGLGHGAHDFLHKPFNQQELFIKVSNILTKRNRLYEKIQNDPMHLFSNKSDFLKTESDFLNRLKELIGKHYSDTDKNLEWFCENLNMSTSTFSRKMKSMTGQTFLDYLKKYRLFKAAELLKKKDIQITEVCFAVGFNHRSYFAKAFKEEFGKSPREFIKTNKG